MRLVAFLIAVAGGFLLNKALPPEVVYSNQILAVFGWGLVLLLAKAPAPTPQALRMTLPMLAALALVTAGCVASVAVGGLPASPAVATIALLAMAGLLVLHGAAAGARDLSGAARPFFIAVVCAGGANAAISVVQVFFPGLVDNGWIAGAVNFGRAVGNLGQANNLADSLVWALAGLVALAESRDDRAHGLRAGFALLAFLLLVGIVLSGSRTGILGIGFLLAWGVLDRGLSKPVRWALLTSPLSTAAAWLLASLCARWSGIDVDLGKHTVINFRDAIWSDALAMIGQQPWTGVGWGQFGFAWTLTPNAHRVPFFIDNAHDLPLQLAVELGVPMAIAILGLLVIAIWRAVRHSSAVAGPDGASLRAGLVILAMVGLHSGLEYPLWYTFFLLPTAWVSGLVLGAAARRRAVMAGAVAAPAAGAGAGPAASHRAWGVAGALFMASAASAWMAYLNIVSLYQPARDAAPLEARIRGGQAGLLFSTHADYVLATLAKSPADAIVEIQRAARARFDGPLLMTWMNALEAHGDEDKARYVAARVREFDPPPLKPFFAACDDAAVTTKPFQCLAPARPMSWRDFR